jgi:hypothetical protein
MTHELYEDVTLSSIVLYIGVVTHARNVSTYVRLTCRFQIGVVEHDFTSETLTTFHCHHLNIRNVNTGIIFVISASIESHPLF